MHDTRDDTHTQVSYLIKDTCDDTHAQACYRINDTWDDIRAQVCYRIKDTCDDTSGQVCYRIRDTWDETLHRYATVSRIEPAHVHTAKNACACNALPTAAAFLFLHKQPQRMQHKIQMIIEEVL